MNKKNHRSADQLTTGQSNIVRLALVQMYISRQDNKEQCLEIRGDIDERMAAAILNCDNDIEDLAGAFSALGLGDINAYAATLRRLAQ